jgi:hypothetical protein
MSVFCNLGRTPWVYCRRVEAVRALVGPSKFEARQASTEMVGVRPAMSPGMVAASDAGLTRVIPATALAASGYPVYVVKDLRL